MRRMVLAVLKQIKTKSSLNGMRLKAGWDEAYMEEILLKIKGF
ncbi:Mobile element protein [Fimbriiglobus ruber]|uniref:Mobile element protein n=1 Tax=Fimbriiglobus ruber TaxID=1908690 RepID=A0A225DEH2_9BACT|nr:Mobile element protein [Fimbriiglobus ruber]